MTERILFVDDEPNVLSGFRRLLRKDYELDTAEGGAAGLELMAENNYAVIVSDMRMPGMSGEEFLEKAHIEQPDAIQLILSGQANLESTVVAVNNGNIFRFLVKPVERDTLTAALDKALRQYRLINAERDLLENTLSGAVAALTEVVSLVSPAAQRRTRIVVDVVKHVAGAHGLQNDWQLDLAAMLSGVGYATIPSDIVERASSGAELTDPERLMMSRHADVTARLLGPIPRLENVSNILVAQANGGDAPAELHNHVRIFDVAVHVAEGVLRGTELSTLIREIRAAGETDAAVLEALRTLKVSTDLIIEERTVAQLTIGSILQRDVTTLSDVMLAASGTEVTESLLEKIRNFATSIGVVEPLLVGIHR